MCVCPWATSASHSALGRLPQMPGSIACDQARRSLTIGTGEFAPVRPEVAKYPVGGRNVFKSWFDYRKKAPGTRLSQKNHCRL